MIHVVAAPRPVDRMGTQGIITFEFSSRSLAASHGQMVYLIAW